MSLARVETLILAYRAWLCAILGPLLAHFQLVIAHSRPIGRNIRMSPSLLNGPVGRSHRGDIGSQYTATSEVQRWVEEAEKNNYHYPFHMEYMQASGLQSRATRSRASHDKNNSAHDNNLVFTYD